MGLGLTELASDMYIIHSRDYHIFQARETITRKDNRHLVFCLIYHILPMKRVYITFFYLNPIVR